MSHWCKRHPRYEAKRTPKAICGDCWALFLLKNPEHPNRHQFKPTLDITEELSRHEATQ